MTKSWEARVAALLLFLTAAGFMAVFAAPDGGRVTGIWPVGVATGCLLVARRRRMPLLLALILLIAVLTIWQGGRPFEVAVGYALGTTLEVWVVWRLLTNGVAERPTLKTDQQLRRYFLAAAAGGVVACASGFATSLATGWGSPVVVALALGAAHLSSELTLVPFFSYLPGHGSISSPRERVAQWLLILTLTPLVFFPRDFPLLAFVVIPVLAWGALRLRPREALAQMVTVLAFAIAMTSRGRGPFADVPNAYGLAVDARGIVLATFSISCALIVIPLLLRVGQYIEVARGAAAERDKMENIVNGATGVAIIGTDEVGRITLFNPGAQRLLGYDLDDVLGRFTTMFHSQGAIADKARELGVANDFLQVVRALTAPGFGASDMRFLRKDGVERTHSMTLTRMVDDRGRVTGYVSTSEDVTERVRAAAALEEALEAERQALESLRSVDAVKEAFVSSVSHELRTPLTSIHGYLELLAEGAYGELNPQQVGAVQRVSDNSRRLLSLIGDLLTLSRLQEEGLGLSDRAFDLREVVRAGFDVVVSARGARELDVRLVLHAEPVPFVGDREMVERVVMNLVSNAVKFTADGGSVSVDLSVTSSVAGSDALLVVSDTGIGIPIQEQEHLFTRFFRSTTAQQRAIPGSGLGLSIARAIVEQHGGSIEVESAADEGTTFRVRMPVVT